ncbi:sulfotransferase family protein [Phenylobacterium immobile]|uniref:sulfotransferase family protein n=1 Tax=Phenylobacterium immobile TaxID=21 RepID=UPI000A79AC18|nr:hypothetical protein [Phenylobacterium immobile]
MTAAPDTPDRTAYLVLGMHRSGTSAVTQLLALAGADLPTDVIAGDENNARGYFEPWRIAVFNDARLRAAGSAWDDVFCHPYRAVADASADRTWANRAKALFAAEYGTLARPLLKDPRVTVLMPMWRQALDELGLPIRCVVPVRHPLAVAGSLARRNGFPVEKSVLLWAAYMLAAEAHSRGLPRAFLGYDALLADWRSEVAKVEIAIGAPLPALTDTAAREIDAFLTPELRHNVGDGDLATLGWAGALADQVFQALSRTEVDQAALDAAAAELERRRVEFGFLVSPAARDLDQARADLADARAAADQGRHDAVDLAALERAHMAVDAQLDQILRDTEAWLKPA